MEVHFTPEQEAQFRQRAEFLAGVQRGIAAADRGELIDHGEMVNRIERLFQL